MALAPPGAVVECPNRAQRAACQAAVVSEHANRALLALRRALSRRIGAVLARVALGSAVFGAERPRRAQHAFRRARLRGVCSRSARQALRAVARGVARLALGALAVHRRLACGARRSRALRRPRRRGLPRRARIALAPPGAVDVKVGSARRAGCQAHVIGDVALDAGLARRLARCRADCAVAARRARRASRLRRKAAWVARHALRAVSRGRPRRARHAAAGIRAELLTRRTACLVLLARHGRAGDSARTG